MKRPRTESREVRRRQLIEATIDSISSNGLSGTTMATVTGRADLSMGIVSFHFKSKENLMKETLMFLVREHRDFWMKRLEDSGLTPEAKLLSIIEANFHPDICTRKRIAVWFAFFGEAKYRKTYREEVPVFDAERTQAVERICREIIAEAGYEGVDASDCATSFECFADGLWLNLMMYPDWLTREEAKRQIIQHLGRTFPRHFGDAEAEPCGQAR